MKRHKRIQARLASTAEALCGRVGAITGNRSHLRRQWTKRAIPTIERSGERYAPTGHPHWQHCQLMPSPPTIAMNIAICHHTQTDNPFELPLNLITLIYMLSMYMPMCDHRCVFKRAKIFYTSFSKTIDTFLAHIPRQRKMSISIAYTPE